MSIFDRFGSRNQLKGESARNVHPDFQMTAGGFWYQNRRFSPERDGQFSLKVTFKFDDPALLDDCPFLTKFGLNDSDGPKYFGMAYGNETNKDAIIAWARKFPWARLLEGLDDEGVVTDDTVETDLIAQA